MARWAARFACRWPSDGLLRTLSTGCEIGEAEVGVERGQAVEKRGLFQPFGLQHRQAGAYCHRGQLGTTGQRLRTQGVKDVFKRDDCKGMEILEEQTADYMRLPAIDLMNNWLTAGFKFDA